MLSPERQSQILRFSKLFQWDQQQESIYLRRLANHLATSQDFEKDFIQWNEKNWPHLLKSLQKTKQEPDTLNEFLRKEPQDHASVVLWHQLMNFSEDTVCRSLNLTAGTFRYRLTRGLCSLGRKL